MLKSRAPRVHEGMRVNPLCALLPVLAGCVQAAPPPAAPPAIYASLASSGVVLNADAARDLINGYRRNHGLAALVLDPALMAEAARQASAMAVGGNVSMGARTDIRTRLAAAGLGQRQARESASAGYFTVSDAFSGWRGSQAHDATMRFAAGKRLGLAAEHRAGSRHNIYWSLIVSD
jgi:uncharacterized protein YkwD